MEENEDRQSPALGFFLIWCLCYLMPEFCGLPPASPMTLVLLLPNAVMTIPHKQMREFLAHAWTLPNDKARKLGWIV
jgi:hypothetical protein